MTDRRIGKAFVSMAGAAALGATLGPAGAVIGGLAGLVFGLRDD
jgi:Na+/H+ antiporter NhaD/arsenite permease-like protein